MPKYRVKLLQCPNCETPLPDAENYCPNCGQENHEIIRPASHLLSELMESVMNIDSRFFHTIKALFLNPGKLTKEYNAGKRMSYLPPIRIYLIASVLFFLSQSISTRLSNEQISEIKKEFNQNSNDSMNIKLFHQTIRITNAEMLALSEFSDEKIDSFLIEKKMTPNFFNRTTVRQSSKVINGNVNNLAEKFQQYLSFSMFLFMPLMGLILMLFFRKQKRFYVEHLIFSVHYHAIAFFILSGLGFLGFLPLDIIPLCGMVIQLSVLIYLLLSLKNVYQESWIKTILKMFGILITYGFFVLFGIVAIALLALIIF